MRGRQELRFDASNAKSIGTVIRLTALSPLLFVVMVYRLTVPAITSCNRIIRSLSGPDQFMYRFYQSLSAIGVIAVCAGCCVARYVSRITPGPY